MFVYKFNLGEGDEKVEHTIALKPFDQIPTGVLRKNRDNAEAGMWSMFEWALTEKDLELFDQMPAKKVDELMTAWQKDANVDAPKS